MSETTSTSTTTTSTRSLSDRLQTYAIVTIIAALIWLYAEDEQVRDFPNEIVEIEFVAPEGRQLLIEPGTTQSIRASFRGGQGQYMQLQQVLNAGPLELVVKEDAGDDPVQQVLLKDKLLENERLLELGMSVTEVQPATMPVRVERLEGVDVALNFLPGEIALLSPASVEPQRATVLAPPSLAAQLEGERLEVRAADVPNLASLPVDVAHTFSLPIHLPAALRGQNLRIDPPNVRVTFTIRRQTDTLKLTAVPVLLLLPPAAVNDYVIRLEGQDQFLHDVELSGPSDLIAAIGRNEVQVNAILHLSSEDLDSRGSSKQLRIDVPPGVTVLSPIPRVQFSITPLKFE